jgi:ribonuclease E
MRPETVAASPEETAAEAERTARRRSTVREKVSFLASPPPDTAPVMPRAAEPAPAPSPAPAETAPATTDEQPRKAGWWSRRFGSGE